MDNLSKCAFLARQEGLSYGQWMAKHRPKTVIVRKPKLPDNICPQCGKEFEKPKGSLKKYCSKACCDKWHHERRKRHG